jgi:hypothetical protein
VGATGLFSLIKNSPFLMTTSTEIAAFLINGRTFQRTLAADEFNGFGGSCESDLLPLYGSIV